MNGEKLESLTKQALDEREKSLSGHIQSALTQARYSAVSSAKSSRNKGASWWWGAVATAASITLAVLIWQPMFSTPVIDGFVFEDMEMMISEGSLELYEDLEFIAWLEETENSG
ncbi:MAG: hypothetical protein JKX92_15825 [Porticoccaceae bacterium]|nr:hypothetical protein [Porticoccaceae bacterium]